MSLCRIPLCFALLIAALLVHRAGAQDGSGASRPFPGTGHTPSRRQAEDRVESSGTSGGGVPELLPGTVAVAQRQPAGADSSAEQTDARPRIDPERFLDGFGNDATPFGVGVDLYSPPEFEGGLIVFGRNVAMKVGGYAKGDIIYDFDAIDATDFFTTTSIPVDAPPRTNARFHARQTRLSFDTRWATGVRPVRIFVEGDFFGSGSSFGLRHAYGETGPLLVGQTWTTFTDVAAAPATLDFEGSVSAVNRRQALARWTQPLGREDLTASLAVEDTRFLVERPPGVRADPRSPSPDLVGRVRLERDRTQFQIAGLYRLLGVQTPGDDVAMASAWGVNFTGAILLRESTRAYYQILLGEGIGSYRDLPDAALTGTGRAALLPLFGWMVGITHDWSETLSSNVTYAENAFDNPDFQRDDALRRTTYLAVNLIWNPLERVDLGIEYLYGLRENVDESVGTAHRVHASFIFELP